LYLVDTNVISAGLPDLIGWMDWMG